MWARDTKLLPEFARPNLGGEHVDELNGHIERQGDGRTGPAKAKGSEGEIELRMGVGL